MKKYTASTTKCFCALRIPEEAKASGSEVVQRMTEFCETVEVRKKAVGNYYIAIDFLADKEIGHFCCAAKYPGAAQARFAAMYRDLAGRSAVKFREVVPFAD